MARRNKSSRIDDDDEEISDDEEDEDFNAEAEDGETSPKKSKKRKQPSFLDDAAEEDEEEVRSCLFMTDRAISTVQCLACPPNKLAHSEMSAFRQAYLDEKDLGSHGQATAC